MRLAAAVALLICMLSSGCSSFWGPRVVFVPAPDAPVRSGPDVSGRVYVWNGKEWELSRNAVTIPEGFYIWDGSRRQAPTGTVSP
jgi:hypothetical protein